MTPLVLLVEDEEPVRRLLAYNLRASGFRVAEAEDAEGALALVAEQSPDVVVVDWMLPGRSGLDLCLTLRRRPETRDLAILFLTARGEEADRLRGLDLGADDYVVKPFSPAEVIARIRAVLRRRRPSLFQDRIEVGDIRLEPASGRAYRRGRLLRLAPTEWRLLQFLLEHPGRLFDRDTLLARLWPASREVEPRAVDAAVRRLRRALNAAGEADPIRTVRGQGYGLRPPEAWSADADERGQKQRLFEKP